MFDPNSFYLNITFFMRHNHIHNYDVKLSEQSILAFIFSVYIFMVYFIHIKLHSLFLYFFSFFPSFFLLFRDLRGTDATAFSQGQNGLTLIQ